jgi:Zn-finger nucleic acid-binding protein
MKCPKCKTIELRGGGPYASPGNRAGSCPTCGGIWIQSNNFSAIADHFGESPKDSPESEENNDPDSRTGLCPDGHGIMIRAKVPLEPPFYLEKCGACGGIWFDRGELSRVLESDLISNLSVIWTMAWQRRQHQQEGLEQYRRIQKEKLGEEIYEQIVRLAEILKDHPHKIRGISLLHHELETGPEKPPPS